MRLVTPERTRQIVDASELREISPESSDVDRIIGQLVSARLVVVHTRGEGEGAPAIEIVHESLIKSWPTLLRWLDESHEDVAFISQLRAAAKQWEQKGRPEGLLWRNEAMEEARLWNSRGKRDLPAREHDFLHAVLELADRGARRKRRTIVGAFVFLVALVAAAGVALLMINKAEKNALQSKRDADIERQKAEISAAAANKSLEDLKRADAQRDAAELAEKQAKQQQEQSDAAAASAKQLADTEAKQKAVAEHERLLADKRAADEAAKRAAMQKKQEDDQKRKSGQITNSLK
jgi:eukaryotic-like serine/threonine-protein kinase